MVAFALGADGVQVGREAMFALGCIQAQRCHTDRCPTGVATQDTWLQRGLDPESKAERVKNYVVALRRDLLKVSEAVGVCHPGLIGPDDVRAGNLGARFDAIIVASQNVGVGGGRGGRGGGGGGRGGRGNAAADSAAMAVVASLDDFVTGRIKG